MKNKDSAIAGIAVNTVLALMLLGLSMFTSMPSGVLAVLR